MIKIECTKIDNKPIFNDNSTLASSLVGSIATIIHDHFHEKALP